MATAVIMPKQGQSVESCIIGSWYKAVGDAIAVGDALFSYETDKATFTEEAKLEGTLLVRFYEEGDEVLCFENVCVIGASGEDYAQYTPKDEKTDAQEPQKVEVEQEVPQSAQVVSAFAKPYTGAISPRARALAQKHNADLSRATASGPNGRLIERDVQRLIDAGAMFTPAAAQIGNHANGTGIGGRVSVFDGVQVQDERVEQKLSNIRKLIGKSMKASLGDMAQLTYNNSFDVTDMMAYRAKSKEAGHKFSVTDAILFAVSRVLKNHPNCNAHCLGDKIVLFKHVHLGLAVDTERGLMVPTIRFADTLSLEQISAEAKRLATMCRSGSISPDLLEGGTFTVSNLGTFGVQSFTPIINPPQTAILGVCTTEMRIKEQDGRIMFYKALGLSLTSDHRVLDGGPSARFLQDLVEALENFSALVQEGGNDHV